MYLSVIHPCVKNAPFHREEGMIMVVRVLYCRWYVSCESPQGMFFVLYSGTNHTGGPSPHLATLVPQTIGGRSTSFIEMVEIQHFDGDSCKRT